MISIPAEVKEQLPSPQLLIGDRWVDEASGGVHDHVNPSTGEIQAHVPLAGPAEIDAAVTAARAAFPAWRRMPANERRDLLLRLAQALLAHTDELSVVAELESGVPAAFAPVVCGTLPAEYFTYYAGWVDKISGEVVPVYPGNVLDYGLREPFGVAAVIIPWNGPVTSIGQKVAPALAAGNCVVLKPPELAPFTSIRFGDICREVGLPPGVINIVPGGAAAGAHLVGHPDVDIVSFTGGVETAKRVQTSAAESLTPLILELGGKSANLVFADADLEAAAAAAVQYSVAALSGQGCILATRLFVEDSIYDDFVGQVVDVAGSLVVGSPFDESTMMGPVISGAACERILGYIRRAEAEKAGALLCGGERLDGDLADGFFIGPTVFGEVDNRSEIAQQEVFGPVLTVSRFRTDEEAVRLANDSRYGLAGYIWTRDLGRAHRLASAIDAGYISINGFALVPPTVPFGGVKDSGYGREGGRAGIDAFLRSKNVYIDLEV